MHYKPARLAHFTLTGTAGFLCLQSHFLHSVQYDIVFRFRRIRPHLPRPRHRLRLQPDRRPSRTTSRYLHGITLGTGEENDVVPFARRLVGRPKVSAILIGHCARIAAARRRSPVPHNVTVAGVPAKIVGEAGCAEPSRTMDQMLHATGL